MTKVTCCLWRFWLFGLLVSAVPRLGLAQDSSEYPSLSSVLRIGAPSLTIGENHREGPALFGVIKGVAIDGHQHIYVLDASTHNVRRFNSSGQHVATAGRSGRGPGDLAQPYSIWHDGDETLYVVDLLNGVNVFGTRGSRIQYRGRFAEGRGVMAVCKLNGQLIAAGYYDKHILHALDADGRIVKSFGSAFRPDTDEVVQKDGNSGSIVLTCDEPNQRLYVAQAALGKVRSYNADGKVLWESVLPGFRGSQVFRDRKGAVVTLFPKHKTEAILPLGHDHVVLQAHHKERRMAPNATRSPDRARGVEMDLGVITYVISVTNGRVITRQYGGPFLMSRAPGGIEVAAYDDDPFPRVFSLPVSIVSK